MIGRPGSTVWLLSHELRLAWRRMGRQGGRRRSRWIPWALMIGVPVLLALVVGGPLSLLLNRVELRPGPIAAAVTAFAMFTAFTLMLSNALSAAVDALYERADLDLLFSSPLNPRRVMTVRFLGVAAGVFWVYGYFLIGPLAVIAATGHPRHLAALVALFGLALGAAGGGLLLASALFRVLGPRRTRTLAQVLAAFIGAAVFLAAQTRNLLGEAASRSAMQQIMQLARDPAVQVPGMDWPLRALLGEPLPLLAITGLGAAVFAGANAYLGPRFAADAAAAAGAGRGAAPSRARDGAFAAGPFAASLRKELRLLARDPALMTQVLLRVLYLAPLAFILLRQAGEGADYLLPGGAAALSLFAGQIAGSLAWITISAEDAPDLLVSSPAQAALVRRGKLAAAALPIAVILAPFLVGLIVLAPLAGVAAALGCAASVFATCLINVWWQRPAKRAQFRNRRRASWFVTVAELLVALLIGAATALVAAGFVAWGVIPAALAGLAMLALRRSDAQIAESLRAAA